LQRFGNPQYLWGIGKTRNGEMEEMGNEEMGGNVKYCTWKWECGLFLIEERCD